jgi:hypothetical protein
MSLNQFLLDVGSQLQELIWRDAPQKTLLEAIDRLERRVRDGSAVLARGRLSLDELRRRVVDRERRESWLASRVEVYLHVGDQPNAWRHALELDQLRNSLQRERERLQRRWQTYREQKAYLEKLREELADLLQQSHRQSV